MPLTCHLSRKLLFPLAALALSACSPNVETRGYLTDPEWKEKIVAGETTRDQVMEVLGSPSARSSFGPETWYYITTRRESYAFFKPEITKGDVTQVTFNREGVVESVGAFDETMARDIDIAGRVTPTEGHQLSFIEQLLGNVGRFNAPSTSPGTPASTRRGRY